MLLSRAVDSVLHDERASEFDARKTDTGDGGGVRGMLDWFWLGVAPPPPPPPNSHESIAAFLFSPSLILTSRATGASWGRSTSSPLTGANDLYQDHRTIVLDHWRGSDDVTTTKSKNKYRIE